MFEVREVEADPVSGKALAAGLLVPRTVGLRLEPAASALPLTVDGSSSEYGSAGASPSHCLASHCLASRSLCERRSRMLFAFFVNRFVKLWSMRFDAEFFVIEPRFEWLIFADHVDRTISSNGFFHLEAPVNGIDG